MFQNLSASLPDLKAYLEGLSDGRGADYVYDCTGVVPGILSGLDCCKRKGTFVAIGMNMGSFPLDTTTSSIKRRSRFRAISPPVQ